MQNLLADPDNDLTPEERQQGGWGQIAQIRLAIHFKRPCDLPPDGWTSDPDGEIADNALNQKPSCPTAICPQPPAAGNDGHEYISLDSSGSNNNAVNFAFDIDFDIDSSEDDVEEPSTSGESSDAVEPESSDSQAAEPEEPDFEFSYSTSNKDGGSSVVLYSKSSTVTDQYGSTTNSETLTASGTFSLSTSFGFSIAEGITLAVTSSGSSKTNYVSSNIQKFDTPDYSIPTGWHGNWHYPQFLNEERFDTTSSFAANVTLGLGFTGDVSLEASFSAENKSVETTIYQTDSIYWESDDDGVVTYKATGVDATTDTNTYTMGGDSTEGFTASLVRSSKYTNDLQTIGTPISGTPHTPKESTSWTTVEDLTGSMPESSSVRTTDDILTEYQDRVTKRNRLQNLLVDPDRDLTPSERQHYTDQIAIQNDIIADLAQEALDAGVTQADLDAISAQAGTGVVNDAIDLEEFTPESTVDDALFGFFIGILQGDAMFMNHLTFNSYTGWFDSLTGIQANETIDGWIEDNGGTYWWANESARVGAHALHLAFALEIAAAAGSLLPTALTIPKITIPGNAIWQTALAGGGGGGTAPVWVIGGGTIPIAAPLTTVLEISAVLGIGSVYTHTIDWDNFDEFDDDLNTFEKMAEGDNTKVNEFTNWIKKRIPEKHHEQLHREISKKGLSRDEILEFVKDISGIDLF